MASPDDAECERAGLGTDGAGQPGRRRPAVPPSPADDNHNGPINMAWGSRCRLWVARVP